MGSSEGALKTAARRLGLTVEEYKAQVAAGLKWCIECRQWQGVEEFGVDRSRGDGLAARCLQSKRSRERQRYVRRPRPQPGRRFVASRDGDKKQARRRVNHLVDTGLLPDPGDVPCADCGHLGPDGPRHEYDHHLGYGAAYHEAVEAVCSTCHRRRENART